MKPLAALAFLLVACTSQPPVSASATPSPLTCRLPVISGTRGQGAGPQTPGFLSLPGLTFTAATDADDGVFYDKPLKRWVPWGPPALSADGSSYAYVDGDKTSSKVHLVDVRTKADVVLATGGPWRLVGLQPDAVYVMGIKYLPFSEAYGVLAVGQGLWKVPLHGNPTQLTRSDGRNWSFIGGGGAWGDGSGANIAGKPNDVVRFDLRTGELTTWFDHATRAWVLGLDAGGVPLIWSNLSDDEIWRAPGPGSAARLWSSAVHGSRPYAPIAVDGGTVWFSSDSLTPAWQIYRYTAAQRMELVANFTDHPVTVAGPCL